MNNRKQRDPEVYLAGCLSAAIIGAFKIAGFVVVFAVIWFIFFK